MQILLSFLISLIAFPIFACSCGTVEKITTNEIENVGEAFIGTVKKVERDDSNYTMTATFEVMHYLKGKAHTSEITVTTSESEAACGLNFREGQKWYVFAYYSGDELRAGLCGRSVQLSKVSFPVRRLIIGRKYYRNEKKRARKDRKAILKYVDNSLTQDSRPETNISR